MILTLFRLKGRMLAPLVTASLYLPASTNYQLIMIKTAKKTLSAGMTLWEVLRFTLLKTATRKMILILLISQKHGRQLEHITGQTSMQTL